MFSDLAKAVAVLGILMVLTALGLVILLTIGAGIPAKKDKKL